MALYKLDPIGVVRSDGLHIPNDTRNRHWQEYLAWVALGNTPDPEFTQAELDAQAAEAAERALRLANRAAAKADALVAELASRTPAEIDAYIVANVTDLASAKLVLRALAQVVGVLAREF